VTAPVLVNHSSSHAFNERQCLCTPCAPRRAPTPPEVLEQRERERELKELDRDTRTVFAYNLNLKADEKDLFDFFTRAGTVRPLTNLFSNQSACTKTCLACQAAGHIPACPFHYRDSDILGVGHTMGCAHCIRFALSMAIQVEDVRIIMDRNTRRSKGFAYIEMGSRVSPHLPSKWEHQSSCARCEQLSPACCASPGSVSVSSVHLHR
jgi:hypothetical protein